MQACLNAANIIARHDCAQSFLQFPQFGIAYYIGVIAIAAIAYIGAKQI
jgi:hypothetical protein